MNIIDCPNCGKGIKGSILKGIVHIRCKECQSDYVLDQISIKKQLLLPLISVGVSVGISSTLLKDRTIDIKFLFILILSFSLAYFLTLLLVKVRVLRYEKKE
ncbi:MAG: hypothetical protein RR945_11175 [Erysipelotrichaceae bacterium]